MSRSPGPPLQNELSTARARGILSVLRPASLLVLLGGEALVLGLRFDAQALAESPSPALRALATVVGGASAFAVTLLAASLLLGSKRWSAERAGLRAAIWPRAFWLRLALQLASFATLFAASAQLFDATAAGAWEIAVWMLALVATLATWLALWASWKVLRRLAWRLVGLIAGSLVLGGLAYGGGRLSRQLWEPLRAWTFALVAPLTKLLVPAAKIDAQACVIETDTFGVEIAAQCSGYEGIGLTLVFLASFFWLFRDRLRFPRVLLLVLPMMATVWLLNVVRIAALVAVGVYVSQELALGSFHSYMGSLLFAGANLAIMFTVLRTPRLLREGAIPQAAHVGENLAASYLVPFLSIVAAALLSATFSSESGSTWYPIRVVAGAAALVVYRKAVRRFLRADDRTAEPTSARGTAHSAAWIAGITLLTTAAWLVASAAEGAGDSADLVPAFSASARGQLAGAMWWLFRIAGTVVVVPLAEELAFRGFVMRRLTSPDVEQVRWAGVTPFALVAQAILFGLLHPHHMLGGALAGLAFGWLGRRTRCGYAPALAHAVTNALVLVLALLTSRWGWL